MGFQADLVGHDHHWLACDSSGNLALLSTLGMGGVPDGLLGSVEEHDAAIKQIMAEPPSCEASRWPEAPLGPSERWLHAAQRGLFVFEFSEHRSRYECVAVPSTPRSVNALPDAVAAVVRAIPHSRLLFSPNAAIDAGQFRYGTWRLRPGEVRIDHLRIASGLGALRLVHLPTGHSVRADLDGESTLKVFDRLLRKLEAAVIATASDGDANGA